MILTCEWNCPHIAILTFHYSEHIFLHVGWTVELDKSLLIVETEFDSMIQTQGSLDANWENSICWWRLFYTARSSAPLLSKVRVNCQTQIKLFFSPLSLYLLPSCSCFDFWVFQPWSGTLHWIIWKMQHFTYSISFQEHSLTNY